MDNYEFLLEDRIVKIRSINEQYDLENTSYIAFSGGKDSVILHHLIDMALPGNNIPRVFANTGIEYVAIVNYVKDIAAKDKRFIIVNQDLNIKKTLDEYGYPFKYKEYSQKVTEAKKAWEKKGELPTYLKRYIEGEKEYINKKGEKKKTIMSCPHILKYQFEKDFKLNVS